MLSRALSLAKHPVADRPAARRRTLPRLRARRRGVPRTAKTFVGDDVPRPRERLLEARPDALLPQVLDEPGPFDRDADLGDDAREEHAAAAAPHRGHDAAQRMDAGGVEVEHTPEP